jgi:hypothetical protein
MSFLSKALAFGCGAILTGLAIGTIELMHAQSSGPTLNFCFGPNNDLRIVAPGVPCLPEEERVQVKQPDPKPKDDPERDSRVAALERRLEALEERERRGHLVPARVVAPFEVVNKNKQRLFRVEEENATLYDKNRQPSVWMFANSSGGGLQVQMAGGGQTATLSAMDSRANLLIQENESDRVDLGRRNSGQYALRIFSAGQVVAYLGQSKLGNGIVSLADKAGHHRVQAFADDAKATGYVAVYNNANHAVGTLYGGAEGDGRLTLTNASGEIRVEAGVVDQGRGVVRTGPNMWNSGVGFLGLVPSYILGKAQ